MKYYFWILFVFITITNTITAQEAQFSPPKGWRLAEKDQLPSHVQVMVVGEGELEFPPSINLSTETFFGTLKDYLKIVKKINEDRGSEWNDLGKIKTLAGEASLSQATNMTKWGPVRMMHVILVRDDTVYILSAAALQNEFSNYYKQFFESFRTFNIH